MSSSSTWAPLAPSKLGEGANNKPKRKRARSRTRPMSASEPSRAVTSSTSAEHHNKIGRDGKRNNTSVSDDSNYGPLLSPRPQRRGTLLEGVSLEWTDSNRLVIELQANYRLAIFGRGRMKWNSGAAIEILGYELSGQRKTSGWTDFECPKWGNAFVLAPVVASEDRNPATVMIESIRQGPSSQGGATFSVHAVSDVRHVHIPSRWSDVVHSLLIPPKISEPTEQAIVVKERILICGAKSVGKSTLMRYLLHRMLQQEMSQCHIQEQHEDSSDPDDKEQAILLLDCDVGQPELSPPGMLTLTRIGSSDSFLSPTHMHMRVQHEAARFFGNVTTRSNPTLFLELVRELVGHFDHLGRKSPHSNFSLVVNTNGWVKGLGLELLTTLINDVVKPTHVLQLVGDMRSQQFDLKTKVSESPHLFELPAFNAAAVNSTELKPTPAPSSPPSIPSSGYRDLRLCTYILDNDVSLWDRLHFDSSGIVDENCEIALRLAAKRPYRVSWDSVAWRSLDAEDALLSSPEQSLQAMNGRVVGLCCVPEEESDKASDTETLENPVSIASSRHPSCVGLGLVRSIDFENRVFYVLTPVPLLPLSSVNLFLLSPGISLPVQCYNRGGKAESFPFVSCDGVVVTHEQILGQNEMKSRNTIQRKTSKEYKR